MAPPTAASKLSATWLFSAAAARLKPWRASSALLAVTTDFPAFSAAVIADFAGSPEPPSNSTNTSISGSLARATGPSQPRPQWSGRIVPPNRRADAQLGERRTHQRCPDRQYQFSAARPLHVIDLRGGGRRH